MTPVFLRQLCRMEPDGLLRHVIYLGIVVQAVPGFAMLVACNLLIPKASWQDDALLSLVARPMYLPGSG